ncbi:DUF6461 domain-containing protein [Nocardiopsis sp. EMB25]|uniref:DUF6461 domain-containing protein n=1 Tax=Nocardiopsis sp. EMB25 TaxID=2835867 RepID=UPI002283F6F4|nr:DUF6461 domain-containing protein [Nocardiopsis sp. EMB25]MCY9783350.1 DUF6461 domain-containing protein [Nocardiopsis sp. EMB25]
MNVTSTAADYLWFEEDFPDLAEAYCLSLVRGLAPAEVLRRLDGRPEPSLTGAEAVTEAAFEHQRGDDRQLLAMASVGDWTLVVEPNGYLGVSEERVLPASAGTTWIAHFANINGADAFLWAQDTVARLSFEPLFPGGRWGATPDAVLDAMHLVGFHFGEDEPEEYLPGEAAFALAEHVTGVAITPELLRETAFTCGSAKV